MKRTQSILEYLIVLTAIVVGILFSTFGFRSGIDISLNNLNNDNINNIESFYGRVEYIANDYIDILNNHYNEWNNKI